MSGVPGTQVGIRQARVWDDGGVDDIIEVPIRDESIRLGQLLKLAGVVENGVLAREVIAAGAVSVDGQVETRRGAQIRRTQRVELHGDEFGLPSAALTPVGE